jgi:hypothetical protein
MHRQDRILVKAKDGTGDKKSQDILAEVGAFQVTLFCSQSKYNNHYCWK